MDEIYSPPFVLGPSEHVGGAEPAGGGRQGPHAQADPQGRPLPRGSHVVRKYTRQHLESALPLPLAVDFKVHLLHTISAHYRPHQNEVNVPI